MTTPHDTRSLAAFVCLGALTISLTACGGDDRTPGQLGQEPEPNAEEAEEPREGDAAGPEEQPEEVSEPEEPAEDEHDDPDTGQDADETSALPEDQNYACEALPEDDMAQILADAGVSGALQFDYQDPGIHPGTYEGNLTWKGPDDLVGNGLAGIQVSDPEDWLDAEEFFLDLKETKESFTEVEELQGIGQHAYIEPNTWSIHILTDEGLTIFITLAGIDEEDFAELYEPLAELAATNVP